MTIGRLFTWHFIDWAQTWVWMSDDILDPDGKMWHCPETWPGRVPAAQPEPSLTEDTPNPLTGQGSAMSLFPILGTNRHRQDSWYQPCQAEIFQIFQGFCQKTPKSLLCPHLCFSREWEAWEELWKMQPQTPRAPWSQERAPWLRAAPPLSAEDKDASFSLSPPPPTVVYFQHCTKAFKTPLSCFWPCLCWVNEFMVCQADLWMPAALGAGGLVILYLQPSGTGTVLIKEAPI